MDYVTVGGHEVSHRFFDTGALIDSDTITVKR